MKLPRKFRRLLRRKKKPARKAPAPRRMPVLDSGSSRSKGGSGNPRGNSAKKAPPRKRYRRVHPVKRWFRWLWWKCKRALILAGILLLLAFGWTWFTLPPIDRLAHVTKMPSIVLRDADGRIIGSYGDVYGEFIPYVDLPRSLIDAVIATEDRNFTHHFGIDPLGLARAIYVNTREGRVRQGGSTITQQLAKNVFLTPERTLWRKLREMLLAFKLEARYSKEQILTLYANRVYLGAGTYGVDAAARRYFAKSARDLNLSESAVIAGLLKAPSRYAPTGNPQAAQARAEQVLVNMQDAGYLSESQLAKGRAELKAMLKRQIAQPRGALYFTDWVVDQLPDIIGNAEADLEVKTTLRLNLQQSAEQAVASVMDAQGESVLAGQGALVAMQPDGAVVAMVGGRSYGESQFNRATQSQRQPGSAFKLFVYLTALEGGMSPESTVEDAPIQIGKWRPQNYRSGYQGAMPMRDALAQSINTVSVSLSERFGRANVIAMAERLGVTSELKPDPSLALGSGEMNLLELTAAYAHLAAEGTAVTPYAITEVRDTEGRIFYRRGSPSRPQVLSRETVGMMDDMLMQVVRAGTGRAAQLGRDAAGKTGTTSDYKDAWFIGFTPDLVAGVWVGNDDASPMKKVTGGMLPAAIWKQFMGAALAGVSPKPIYTASRGFSLEGLLPWRDSPAPPPAQRPQAGGEDFELGPSFWDKLEKSGKTEYKYPSQQPNR